MVIPIIFPVTTDLAALAQLAELAKTYGASFFAGVPIELDATARNALARTLDRRRQRRDLRDALPRRPRARSDCRPNATSPRWPAEIGAADFVVPPRWDRPTNWNAAVLLTLTANAHPVDE